jgi:hypothetical protein
MTPTGGSAMRGNPVVGERVWYTRGFPEQPDWPARIKGIEDERRGLVNIELLGGARDGERVCCGYDVTGEFGCTWHRDGDPQKWADGVPGYESHELSPPTRQN